MSRVEEFLSYLKYEKRCSLHTQKAYEVDLLQLREYLLSQYESDLLDVKDVMLRSWMMSAISSGLSKRSLNRKMSSARAFYKYALNNEWIKMSPLGAIKSFKLDKNLPSIVSKDQMDYLLDVFPFDDSYTSRRDKAILEMFYYTGIRLSELIGLKLVDVDFSKKMIKVFGKRSKERFIPLLDSHLNSLKSYIECRSRAIDAKKSELFLTDSGDVLYPKLVYRIVNSYLSEVTGMKQRSPHVLRHAFATHMLNEGADLNAIKEILGHSSLTSTQIYTSNSVERLKKIYKQAHPRGDKDGG